MLPNLFRQSFWAVFVPLLLVAGLFWMPELRGYRAELSILVLPKTELTRGAAGNLAALARQTSFALAVYDTETLLESPLIGKTPAERKAIWKKTAEIDLVGDSDVIRISALGTDQDEALSLAKMILGELVRTGSHYYNQKTDVDIRVVEEPVVIPSLTAWPRFVAYIVATALFFTALFFVVYSLIERLFPKHRELSKGNGEYVITPETFKPRVPAYWGREDHTYPTETETVVADEQSMDDYEYARHEPMAEALETETTPEALALPISPADPVAESTEMADLPEEDEYVEEANIPEVVEDEVREETPYEDEVSAEPDEPAYAGYATHAAAPDNLPIIDYSITPLQGAQARLMKADIDATAEAYAMQAEEEAALTEEPMKPQTHEPTPEEYRRRLNELLSGKM